MTYVLDKDGVPRREKDMLKWGLWFAMFQRRRVAEVTVGAYWVSTIFTGIRMSKEFPQWWETAIFLDGDLVKMKRCGGTMEQAERQHAEIVAKVKRMKNKDEA